MKVENNTNKYSYSFQAKLYSKINTKNIAENTKITIYKLEKSDSKFLDGMVSKIDLRKLAPNMYNSSEMYTWQVLILKAVQQVMGGGKVFLAANEKNKRPCGVVSVVSKYESQLNEHVDNISYFATWPDERGHNVKCAGKSLLKTVFEDALANNKSVTVAPSTTGPGGKRNCEVFYYNLGFQADKRLFFEKIAHKEKISNLISEKLDNVLVSSRVDEQSDINLGNILDLNY